MPSQSPIPDILTPRLRLVHATTAHLNAELVGIEYLARELKAEIPPDWPPEHYDSNVINYVINFLQQNPGQAEWSMRFIVLCESGILNLIGGCGFKGQPDEKGVVEIGYGLTPTYQKQGYATEAALALIDYAFTDPRVLTVIAHTLPDHSPSIGVMLRAGMVFETETTEDGLPVVRYGIYRKPFKSNAFVPTSN